MNEKHNPSDERRHFLKLLGGSAILIPLAGGLTGCGKEPQPEATGTTSTPSDSATDPAPAPAPTADTPPASAGGGEMPKVSLDDPQAKALSYVHDATTVDAAAQPRYKPGQICKNCALYTGDKPWGGCSIFGGKLVNANGWCSAYVPKPT